jgi:hypothetical protein
LDDDAASAHTQWVALAAVTAAALITASCTSAGSYTARSPRVRVTVDSGCPDTLGGAKDVSNPPGGLGNHLVPMGDDPRAGVVCQYAGSQNLKAPTTTVLARSTPLTQQCAARLARALGNVSLKATTGKFECPAYLVGSITIIALNYRGHGADVDLWYSTSGCQTIDNGHVVAFQGANPSFYNSFETALEQVAPRP